MLKKSITVLIACAVLGITAPVSAQTSAQNTTPNPAVVERIVCVGRASATREAALGSAMTTFTVAQNAAYSARATALVAAHKLTTLPATKTAVTRAWANFGTSVKAARKNWRAAHNSAWKQYRATAGTCRAGAGLIEVGDTTVELGS